MKISILGAESLGVRGLSCCVEFGDRSIVIDPGVALGWSRYGLLPHPLQVAVGAGVRQRIIDKLETATDVIISHFDGDHCPLVDANPYQLELNKVKHHLARCQIRAMGEGYASLTQQLRRRQTIEAVGRDLPAADGVNDGALSFSQPVPHGVNDKKKRSVIMTRIEADGELFVHASDIQLLDSTTIETILDWKADIALVSGPPLYRYDSSSDAPQMQAAWDNALKLAANVHTLIVDHHLLRCEAGLDWLARLRDYTGHDVCCAADYMKRQPLLLEAWRKDIYKWLPVRDKWYEDYRKGCASFDEYQKNGWAILVAKGKITPCKWYAVCPIKAYTEMGRLDRCWVENYCLTANRSCIRFQMEEAGRYHPDNMLPDGRIRSDL